MQLSKAGYYADATIYPPTALALTVAVWWVPHSSYHYLGAVGMLTGVAGWTLADHLFQKLFCLSWFGSSIDEANEPRFPGERFLYLAEVDRYSFRSGYF